MRMCDMTSASEREMFRSTFDSAADTYQEARPDYPIELFSDLVKCAGLRHGDTLLEIGCATGKATLPLASLGFRITCVELGAKLAATARDNLSDFPEVSVVTAAFEDWESQGRRFDLLLAANSWHWIDPEVRYMKAHEVLRSEGHLAIWGATHVFPEGGDPFFYELQEVYDEIGEGLPEHVTQPRPGELPDLVAEIAQTGLFSVALVRHYDWEQVCTADEYIDLVSTFSGHIAMEPEKRDYLYSEIRRRIALREDGRIRRHWGTVLNVARRLEDDRRSQRS
jgi:SAM-dependent methyltransferase